MLFNSFEFLVFLPVVFGLYWLLGRHLRLQNLLVVVASYVFYGWWDWRFLCLIAFTSAWSYTVGLIELRRWESRPSKFLLVVSLVVNIGILGAFKYFDFFMDQFAALLSCFRLNADLPSVRVVLPVGISFYTFQALSYTIDVFRRQIRPTRDPVAFFAFISFFPQLVAGPIERATNLLPQFLSPRRFDYAAAVDGCRQMLWGLFKKMVVADNCAAVANALLNAPSQSNGLAVWLGVFMFAVQIYGDFSGYSDIAIGCSRLFGIRLMRNFAFPYFSRDIAEFWRRWHMSLTTWFRDYIYIPLGGSRCGRWRKVRNTFVIFLVSGFWHGANWTFIFWGAFHAFLFLPLLLGGRNRRNLDGVAEDRVLPTPEELLRMLLTFFLVLVGWTFFRAQSMSECVSWLRSMANPCSFGAIADVPHEVWTAIGAFALMTVVEWVNRKEAFGLGRMFDARWVRIMVYYTIAALIFFYTPGSRNFVYFQF